MRIFVALEPRSHRDTLCDAIAQLRPGLDAIAVAPDELEHRPWDCNRGIVVLSRPVPAVQGRAFAWLLIAPESGASALVSIAGRQRAVVGLDLSGLLALLDEGLVAFRAEQRRPALAAQEDAALVPGPLDGLWERLGAQGRTLAGALAPWQYVHMLLIPTLLVIIYGLTFQGRAQALDALSSAIMLVALAGIAAIEARQFRRTHGHRVCG